MRNGPYILIVAPAGYPGKKYRGRYAYEHSVVWWQTTGQVVPEGQLLHHKNEDKHDNRFKNLELKSTAKHNADHNTITPVKLKCAFCDKSILRKQSEHRFRLRTGQVYFYCNRSCFGKHRRPRGPKYPGGFPPKH